MDCIVESNGARISYTVDGPLDRPVLLFINSIGTTRDLWKQQVPALVGTYRIIRYDARGHGSSSVPAGDYTIAQLGRDALAILDAEDVAQAHVCGISLGGLTGLWLALNAPDRVAMRFKERPQTAIRRQIPQFRPEFEIDEDRMTATTLPRRYYKWSAFCPFVDDG